jgi:hypothetical protein
MAYKGQTQLLVTFVPSPDKVAEIDLVADSARPAPSPNRSGKLANWDRALQSRLPRAVFSGTERSNGRYELRLAEWCFGTAS